MPAYRVALTGGVASGKSSVAALFAALGVPIIDSDEIAREVVVPGSPILKRVVERFGAQILQPDGQLDRRRLRALVFADEAARLDLQALLHPAIRAMTDARAAAVRAPYVLIVIPLLVETGAGARFERVLLVDCEEATQIRRLQARDGSPLAEAQAMLASQASRAARLAAADDVIVNEGDVAQLACEVEALHFKYLRLARERENLTGAPPAAP